jgi:hypothetical protein
MDSPMTNETMTEEYELRKIDVVALVREFDVLWPEITREPDVLREALARGIPPEALNSLERKNCIAVRQTTAGFGEITPIVIEYGPRFLEHLAIHGLADFVMWACHKHVFPALRAKIDSNVINKKTEK